MGIPICVPQWQELSGTGAAYAAGISVDIYDQVTISSCMERTVYKRRMPAGQSGELYRGWRHAVQTAPNHG